jgi:hypothetical protein
MSKRLNLQLTLRRAGIDENLLMDLNDLGYTFDEIADYLDRVESQVTD